MSLFNKLGIILFFVGAAWWLYSPLPDDMANQNFVRIANVTMKAIFAASKMGEWLGFGNSVNITRSIHRTLYYKLDTPDRMQIVNTKFYDVPVRIYKYDMVDGGLDSAIVYYHGGGWVIGDLDINDAFLRKLCEKSKHMIFSVDYRLAPEYPYPIPLGDCLKATLHVFRHAKTFGINSERIALMGDSAGGNLVAAVSLKLIDQNHLPMPAVQILIYPAVQIIDFSLPSHVEKSGVGLLSVSDMAFFVLCHLNASQQYSPILIANQHLSRAQRAKHGRDLDAWALPDKYKYAAIGSIKTKGKPENEPIDIAHNADLEELSRKAQDPFVSPLLAKDLSLMPRTYILTAGHDPLLSEALLFADKLERSGVEVEWANYQSSIHGFLSWDVDPNVNIAIDHLDAYLKQNL